nr:hypothetical protein [Tanacetum cinerariifolium]
WDRVFEIKDVLGTKQYKPEDVQELFHQLLNDVQNIHEELAEYINTSGWNCPAFYDDDNDDDDVDYTIVITPVLSTEKPIDSLSTRDEHLDTILATGSDEVIKSSVEDLVLIPKISSGSTTTHSYVSLSEYDSFVFDPLNDQFPPTDRSDFANEEFVDELAHIISPPKYDCFYFRNLLDPGELMSILNFEIHENLSSTTRVNLPIEDDHSPLLAYVYSGKCEDSRQIDFVLKSSFPLHKLGITGQSMTLVGQGSTGNRDYRWGFPFADAGCSVDGLRKWPITNPPLREYCDKHYNQLLPILAEKMHREKVQQEKLKAIKARLNFEAVSQHSESGTPSKRRDLKKDSDQNISVVPVVETLKAVTKVPDREEQNMLLRKLITKENPHEEQKRCSKGKTVQEDNGSGGEDEMLADANMVSYVQIHTHQKCIGEVAASNSERNKSFSAWKQQEAGQKQNFKKEGFHNQQRLKQKEDRKAVTFNKRTKAKQWERPGKDKPLAILTVQPWQRVSKQRITQTFSPETDISFPPLGEEDGTEGPMIIEAEMGDILFTVCMWMGVLN